MRRRSPQQDGGLAGAIQPQGGFGAAEGGEHQGRVGGHRAAEIVERRNEPGPAVLALALEPVRHGGGPAPGERLERGGIDPAARLQERRKQVDHRLEPELGQAGAAGIAAHAGLGHERIGERVVEPEDDRRGIAKPDDRAIEVVPRAVRPAEGAGVGGHEQPGVLPLRRRHPGPAVDPLERLGVLQAAADHDRHVLAGPARPGRRGAVDQRKHHHAVRVRPDGRAGGGAPDPEGDEARDGGQHGGAPAGAAGRSGSCVAAGVNAAGVHAAGVKRPASMRPASRRPLRAPAPCPPPSHSGRPAPWPARSPPPPGAPAATVGRTTRSDGGGSCRCRAMMLCGVRPVNGGSPRQHLVEHAAQGVDIAPAVDVARAGALLRAHVLGGADGEAVCGQPLLARRGDRPRDAEVGHHARGRPRAECFGLDVAMDHAVARGRSPARRRPPARCGRRRRTGSCFSRGCGRAGSRPRRRA